jgi:hypothetical protein
MKEWLLTEWDMALQIELVVNDAMVYRPWGSGPGARNSSSFILWYKVITIVFLPSLPASAMEKLTKPESHGVKFYELQRFCDTIFTQPKQKV